MSKKRCPETMDFFSICHLKSCRVFYSTFAIVFLTEDRNAFLTFLKKNCPNIYCICASILTVYTEVM